MRYLLIFVLAAGAAEFKDLLRRIDAEKNAVKRRDLVERLAAADTLQASHALLKIARHDPDVPVRVVAIAGLGRTKVTGATRLLATLATEGGVRAVRQAVGRALASRGDALQIIHRAILGPKADDLTRGLLIEALGALRGPDALLRLLKIAAGDSAFLRCEALRALARRADGRDELVSLLATLVRARTDLPTAMTVLDLIETRPDVRHLPTVEHLLTRPEPAVLEAARHAVTLLRYRRDVAAARAAAAAAKKEGYEFAPVNPPVPPPPRPRYDLVFGCDSTGSVFSYVGEIQRRIRSHYRYLVENGADVRVGLVVFRDARASAKYPTSQALPLTHDPAQVEAFLAGVRAGGTDSQGAAASVGLTQGLDRMGWRDGASRSFTLIGDSRLDDPPKCYRTVRLHRFADGVRVKVLYLLRTRKKVPEDIVKLAEIGGAALGLLE